MLKAVAKRFRSSRKERTKQIQDAVLGTLRWAEEDWWETNVEINGRTLGFKIGGEVEPDVALISHAREIVHSFADFERMVAEFLAAEARDVKCLRHFAEEIRQLAIEDVCLFWPEKPNNGMIYFKGPDRYRVWRCNYVKRKPRGLGFDS